MLLPRQSCASAVPTPQPPVRGIAGALGWFGSAARDVPGLNLSQARPKVGPSNCKVDVMQIGTNAFDQFARILLKAALPNVLTWDLYELR